MGADEGDTLLTDGLFGTGGIGDVSASHISIHLSKILFDCTEGGIFHPFSARKSTVSGG